MSNNYSAALTFYLTPDLYFALRGCNSHAEVEETLQLICMSGRVSVVLVATRRNQHEEANLGPRASQIPWQAQVPHPVAEGICQGGGEEGWATLPEHDR